MKDVFSVLAIDDDPSQIELLRVYCESLDYPKVEYHAASDAAGAFSILQSHMIDLVLTDFRLPDVNGLDILHRVKELNPEIRVVIMTAYQDTQQAVEILKSGADDYLIKPTKEQDIRRLLILMNEKLIYRRETGEIQREIEETFDESSIVLKSKEMLKVMQTAVTCARSDTTVLLTGESGTGKELVAQLVHKKSRRGNKAFVTVNISALPESLAESELFGHRKGAFTGATEDRMGRFEEAEGGTIFIDEIGDISPVLQVKLLRVLQSGEIQRVGENLTKKLDVRIVAATNRDLRELVRKKIFRSDLYYRINVIPIHLPPLRQRKTDIPALVDHFIEKFALQNGKKVQTISREALNAVMLWPFPGNVRELENIIERAVVFARSETIRIEDLPSLTEEGNSPSDFCSDPGFGEPEGSYEDKMRGFEIKILEGALDRAEGNQSKAAELLSITERHLRSRMARLGLQNRWRPGP
jgi:DNA-binding NtrC family response regulator